MRIAIAAENNNGLDSPISPHFGHAAYFVLADTDGGAIQSVSTIANPFCGSHGCGPVGKFVAEQGAQVMLVGGMGRRAVCRRFKVWALKWSPARPGACVRQCSSTSTGGCGAQRLV